MSVALSTWQRPVESAGDPIRGDGALSAVFAGPLASVPRPVWGAPAAGRSPTFRELRDPEDMAAIQDLFSATYSHGDRRAVASMWSKWFFNAVMPTVLGLLMVERRTCSADESAVGVTLDSTGCPERLWIREPGDVDTADTVATGLERLARDRLAMVVDTLARVSGASRNVFWSNAGNSLEYLVGEMARHPAVTPDVLEQAQSFLECRRFADGQRNPLFRPVRYRRAPDGHGEVERQRRVCCIRYLLPETAYCGNCPLSCRQRERADGPDATAPSVKRGTA